MKNEYKLLIAVIVIILILLVGAYALTGSKGPQATATPTAQPMSTPTPTPTPLAAGTGGSSGGASNPTSTPAPSPTVTPTPTTVPSPTPTSGVEQTQFGYVITYPPLGPENWSAYAPAANNNVVYFSPTSQTYTVPSGDEETAIIEVPLMEAQAIVYRQGNLNCTTNVTIRLSQSSNMYFENYMIGSIAPSSICNYYIPDGIGSTNANLTNNSDGTFTLRFNPGVSEQAINIYIEGRPLVVPFSGTVGLTITGVDAPFTIGTGNQYTLTVNSQSTPSESVEFLYAGGYADNQTYIGGSEMDISDPTMIDGNPWWEANIPLTRTSTSGILSPNIVISDTNIPSGDIYINQLPTFADGQSTAILQVNYTLSGSEEAHSYAYFSISPSSAYTIGTNNPFYFDTFTEW